MSKATKKRTVDLRKSMISPPQQTFHIGSGTDTGAQVEFDEWIPVGLNVDAHGRQKLTMNIPIQTRSAAVSVSSYGQNIGSYSATISNVSGRYLRNSSSPNFQQLMQRQYSADQIPQAFRGLYNQQQVQNDNVSMAGTCSSRSTGPQLGGTMSSFSVSNGPIPYDYSMQNPQTLPYHREHDTSRVVSYVSNPEYFLAQCQMTEARRSATWAAAPSFPQPMPRHSIVDNENPYSIVTAVVSERDNSIRQSFSRRISRNQALQIMGETSLPQIPPTPPPRRADNTLPPQRSPKSYEVSKKIFDAHSPKSARLELTRPATILIEDPVIDKVEEEVKKQSSTDSSEIEKRDSASSSDSKVTVIERTTPKPSDRPESSNSKQGKYDVNRSRSKSRERSPKTEEPTPKLEKAPAPVAHVNPVPSSKRSPVMTVENENYEKLVKQVAESRTGQKPEGGHEYVRLTAIRNLPNDDDEPFVMHM
ncbi:hypothetical protein WR25_15632 [Diploscapter pachys]|uniref:Uncharacterized protein n=1 Tax=Diploscapter pachys TaxID=2018661 RepID=A0A2A2M083_9BILA|nr:hypothetical protein WR25_15632 [Diploscapter pachys]